ncbi:hypothetical protein AX16_001159 [Volvariella volvacea WC 439]|nr:hypothetical protein AX16_001159 [Volvariella volvacea WC 439]
MSLASRSPTPSLASVRNEPSSSQASRNPVSLRLYKVLGTNFTDDATKEALETLSELYALPKHASLPAQVDQADDDLEGDALEDSHVRERNMEPVTSEIAVRARRNLRRDMEYKLAQGSHQFMQALEEVDQKLDEIEKFVVAMKVSCVEAEAQLELTNEASKGLLERAGHLREERQQVEEKRSIISLFLGQFTLDEQEIEALTSRDVPVGERFFQAMDKTERIRNNCRILMSGEDGPTRAGLDIMAMTSTYLEQGYGKIVRWCSNEFRQLGKEMLDVNNNLQESIRRLRTRPELLTEVMSVLSETRQNTLLSSFINALTRGGPSGLPRPIELHAHDPLRYVGDMLAWVHQTIAAEREFLESLFGLKGDGRMVGSVRRFETSEEEEWMKELMDLAVDKLCIPLKSRVQQTVRSQESSIMSYKIANLLQFYTLTMHRTIGEHASLSKALQDVTDLAYNVFYESIQSQGRALVKVSLDPDDKSLLPPLAILEHAQMLREIVSVYQSSLLGDESDEEQIEGFRKISDMMVDPAIEMCATASEEKKRLRPQWDQPVFVLNCLSYVLGVLESHNFTSYKQGLLRELIQERVKRLTEEHFVNLCINAGLYDVHKTCKNHDHSEPLSRLPTAQPAELRASLQKFSQWLSSLEVVQSARLAQLSLQRLHTEIHHKALVRMVWAYRDICDEVRKPENKYEAAATLLGTERPFGQPALLWQVFGLEEQEDEDEGQDEKRSQTETGSEKSG